MGWGAVNTTEKEEASVYQLRNHLLMTVFVEQPPASPGSAHILTESKIDFAANQKKIGSAEPMESAFCKSDKVEVQYST